MKKSFLKYVACVCGTALMLTSCSTSATEGTDEDPKSITGNASPEEIENYRTKMLDQIATYKETIVDLKLRMDYIKPRGHAKETYTKQINALEAKNNELKEKIESYSGKAKAKWEKFKSGFDKEMSKLAEEFKNISVNDIKKFD